MSTLPLSEVFGPTWQGEGPHAGRLCAFVRTGLCNLSCEWCDTPYTWDTSRFDVAAECPDTPIAEIKARLRELDVRMVVLSGGEPLMHHQRLPELLDPRWEWHVETNGTIQPPRYWNDMVTHTTVSPKINTRDARRKRLKLVSLEAWAASHKAIFKFVVTREADLDEIEDLMELAGIWRGDVWVMPEGINATAVLVHHRKLAQGILDHGFNTTTRLHTLLWGSQRGR